VSGHRTAASRVQRFTIVGVVATGVDLAILLWLLTRGVELMYADLASVTVATVASYVLHRMVTLAGHPSRRWYENFAGSYLSAVFGSLCADVVIFTVLVDLFTGGGTSGGADTFPLSGMAHRDAAGQGVGGEGGGVGRSGGASSLGVPVDLGLRSPPRPGGTTGPT
jgi:putative flippase GtrA